MKKQILLAIGLAGMLGAQPAGDANAEISIGINIPGGPGLFFESRPDFIYLDDYGFSVSYGGPYDVVYFDNAYFVFRDGYWFRAWDYRGPWERIYYYELPPPIRRHRWDDIRRYRDVEYRRHDRRYWDERFRQDREHWGRPDDRRGPGRPQGPAEFRGPARPQDPDDRRGPAGPQGPAEFRGPSRPQGPDDRRGPAGPQAPAEFHGPSRPQGPDDRRGPAGPQPPSELRGPSRPQGPTEQRGPEKRDDRGRRDDRDERRDRDGRPSDGDRQERR